MSEKKHYQCYINGSWVDSSDGNRFDVENPATNEVFATVPDCTLDDVQYALETSFEAQKLWQKRTAIERANFIMKIVEGLREDRDMFAGLLVKEQGKTLLEAYGEFDDTLNYMTYAAQSARRMKGDIFPSDNTEEKLLIQKVPYGVTVGVCAYNYPLALVGRKVGPALITGNTMILKAHEETPVTASEFCRVVDEAGLPKGVINLVSGKGISVSSYLVKSPITRLISLTGSTRAGQGIYASAAENVAGLILELGGKATFTVLKDADLEKAADAAVVSRFANCGQVCICNELILVEETVAEEFTEMVIERVKKLTTGDPMTDVNMGPSVTRKGIKRLEQLVTDSITEGAKLEVGGKRPEGVEFEAGNWFEPTVLSHVSRDMDVAKQEIFGPILPIISVKSYDEAVDITNDREDALSCYLFTSDVNKIMRAMDDFEVGTVFINKQISGYVQGYHSGHKRSGTAGEDGVHGIENYLQKRAIYLSYD